MISSSRLLVIYINKTYLCRDFERPEANRSRGPLGAAAAATAAVIVVTAHYASAGMIV